MRVLRRLVSGTSALVLTLSSLMSLGFSGVVHATANNCTWTGTTNNNFNTATNWSGCNSTVPQTGDNLVFDVAGLSADAALNNDIASLSVGSITFSGTNSNFYGYTITGNAITITGGISQTASTSNTLDVDVTLSGSQTFSYSGGSLILGDSTKATSSTLAIGSSTLTLSGTASCAGVEIFSALTGSGTITDTVTNGVTLNADSPSFTGTVNINDGYLAANSGQALGTAAATTNVASGARLNLGYDTDTTFPMSLNVSGNGGGSLGAIVTGDASGYVGCSGGGGTSTTHTATLSGSVALQANTTVYASQYHDLKVTGPLSGSYTLTPAVGSQGTLTIASSNNTSQTPNGSAEAPVTTVQYSDNSPSTSIDVPNNVTGVVDGTYGSTFVESGGILKGIGTVGDLTVSDGGTVAPGHSPGKLTATGTLTLEQGAVYQAELKDKTAGDFDQLTVGSASDTTGNDVTLGDGSGGPTLAATLYSGAKIKAGDQFEIINNLSQTAVSGTFDGLPEGATLHVGNGTMKISYVGGDGNDVVLTALTAITAPDTGLALATSHPGVTLAVSAVAAATIFGLARRSRKLAPARAKATRR